MTIRGNGKEVLLVVIIMAFVVMMYTIFKILP